VADAGPVVILASASPQRRAILAQVGIPFEVRPADIDEDTAGDPAAVAEANARRKAEATAAALHAPAAGGDLVLGADTIVALDGDILGKPEDEAQARAYAGRLNGRTHEVVGGIALVEGDRTVTAVETTRVAFRTVDAATLDWYVATGEWQGRAGGYAIQGAGAALVAGIEGDYLNVVGLPLARLLDLKPELLPGA
jgi:nucleoside triphosphate pyrophosphatase